MNSLFKFGGGAGIGSYVLVIENGTLKPVRTEVVRGSYDKGENLYLSIIDDSTEEALLPLSGYVDNEDILHLSGRDFDDNKTYEFTVNNAEQTISVEEKEGVTIGETTIPTSGGGGGTQLYKHVLTIDSEEGIQNPEYNEITIISWIGESFKNLYWRNLNTRMLNGWTYAGPILGISDEQDEAKIHYIDPWNNFSYLTPNWAGSGQDILDDVVTTL